MAGSSRVNNYNLVSVFFWRVSSTGINYGQLDPDVTETPDTISHALAFIGDGISAALPEATYRRVTFGGSRQLGSAYMGIDPIGEFEIQLSSADANLESMLKGGNIDTTTLSGAKITSPNNNAISPNDIGCMFSVASQSRDSGTDGDTEYRTYVFPRVQGYMVETGGNVTTGENPQAVTVKLTPSFATKHAWGTAFSSNEGFAGNKTDHLKIQAQKPYGITTWIADGVETTFETEFVGASSTITGGNTDNVFTIDGVVTAPTSFTVATGVVTVAAAGSSGDNHCAFYQLSVPITSV